MAKQNHWLDQNDFMVPFNLFGRRKVKVHCHNHVIQLEKEESEKLKLTHVTKDILQRVYVKESIKGTIKESKIAKDYFILHTLLFTEKAMRLLFLSHAAKTRKYQTSLKTAYGLL